MSMPQPRSVEDVRNALTQEATNLIASRLNIGRNQACGAAEQVVDLVCLAYAAKQVAQARGEEREACARLCEGDDINENPDTWGWHKKDYARAIRART